MIDKNGQRHFSGATKHVCGLKVKPMTPQFAAATDGSISQASLSSSVRYFGARAFAFSMNSRCCTLSSSGGAVVRVATDTPNCWKKLSRPAGEQMQSKRTSCEEELWNWWGAFDGTLIVSPARAIDFLLRKVTSISPCKRMKVSSKS